MMKELVYLVCRKRYVLPSAMLLLAVAFHSFTVSAAGGPYRVDPTASHATIHVGKAGAFSFIAGHTHEVSGPIQSGSIDVDRDDLTQSRVRLEIPTSTLTVSAAGEPQGDAPKVQQAMVSEAVLDVARYPRITYESTDVVVKSRQGDNVELAVTGRLTIRGVTQPTTVPVRVDIAGDRLTANGRFAVKQSAFGIKPVSVGGVVAVKDSLEIEFSIAARR